MIFRYSSINTSFECLAKYKYLYIDGMEVQQGADAEFGTAVHLAIKNHFEGQDGLTTFNMYWNSVKDNDFKYYRFKWADLKEIGNELLPRFFKLHAKKFEPEFLEQSMSTRIGRHNFHGTVDFLGDYEGVPSVVDWKTSTNEYKKEIIERSPQMYGYDKLAWDCLKYKAEQIVYKVFVKAKRSIQTLVLPVNENKLNHMLGILENQMNDLEGRTEFTPNPGCYCINPIKCFGG